MFGRRLTAIALAGVFVLVSGCPSPEDFYPDPDLAGRWYLTASGPFNIPENRTMEFGPKLLTYVYPEPTQDLLDDLVLSLPGVPYSYLVTLSGPYTVNRDMQPASIDYTVKTVTVDLDGIRVSLENYLRAMSSADRSRFYTSMQQTMGVTLSRQDVDSLLSAMENYQAAKLLAECAPGFFGLYDVYECDLTIQMALGTRPAALDNPLAFRSTTCQY